MVRWIRHRYLVLAAVVGLAAGCTIAASSFARAGSSRPHARLSPTERRILKIALRAAAGAGDPRPTLIQYAVGTHAKANRISSGDTGGGKQRSYLIAERGRFAFNDVGPDNQTIRGSVITLVLNAKTMHTTDFGLQNNYPKLAALGPVTTLRRTRR